MQKKVYITREPVDELLRQQLVDYVYPLIGCMHYVHEDLGPGLPEYCYQEALVRRLQEEGFEVDKECQFHPLFDGKPLNAFIKMDMVVKLPKGNVIIECKSIKQLTDKEQFQTFGYLRGSRFPIALLVNFGTWPKAQIERYYYHNMNIKAF